jgi:hypothetical protein
MLGQRADKNQATGEARGYQQWPLSEFALVFRMREAARSRQRGAGALYGVLCGSRRGRHTRSTAGLRDEPKFEALRRQAIPPWAGAPRLSSR